MEARRPARITEVQEDILIKSDYQTRDHTMGGSSSKDTQSKKDHGIPAELVSVYREAFDTFDSSGSGAMSVADVKNLLNAFGLVTTNQSLCHRF